MSPTSASRMLLSRRLIGVVLGAGLVLVATAAVTSKGPNVDRGQPERAAATPQIAAIEQLRLSDELADFGEQKADPVALVEAARILKLANAVLKPPASGARTWESLLARAKQIAGANPAVDGLIADVRAMKVRNIPTISADASLLNKSVKQGAADRLEVSFKAGEPALVYVRPVPAVNLDLYVYDEFNNLICTGASGGHEAQCRWRPRWDGRYLVDVRNNNDSEVAYVLAINREIMAH